MKYHTAFALGVCLTLLFADRALADWSQWRGPDRAGSAADFEVPATWPKELKQQWKVTVGDGVATPALVGGKLYVFTRENDQEVVRCLDAASGQEVWQDKYGAEAVTGPASRFGGPRSSPTVAAGKVVTLGAQGTLSCLNAETGEVEWRNNEYEGSVPRFATASSPIVVDGLCIAELGGDSSSGAIVALELATGQERWKWTGDGPSYGSPVLMNIDGTQLVIAPTDGNMVALRVADGKVLWQIAYTQGRYNAATPIVNGQVLIYAGPTRGVTAEKLLMVDEKLMAEELWANPDNSLQFNTPLLKDGLIFGLSNLNSLFCLNAENGETAWTAPLTSQTEPAEAARDAGPREGRPRGDGQAQERPAGQERQRGEGRRGGGGRGGRGGGGGGYGSIVAAGSVLVALTPASELVVYQPNGQAYTEIVRYKVAEGQTYAYPVLSDKRIFIKDADSVTLWTVE